ncbi:alpha/beta fold hydrolase [Actinomadura darangshiensis]|uniref:Alpha/beta fold hydrolase n=1 Tax=Actinomadura darangshiensis TaxID=705336 RepID=A0A4R5B238_9ACTN|nr:alpha/beta hydrolase [Actinomadura darangshiensis]TDD79215.1 alpha/beta fold hydrolase [Actinomadura darangshiensis]
MRHATGADGVRIAFDTAGQGRPLVLLHGFFGDRSTWRDAGYVDALADQYRLICIDARGHGGSDAPRDVGSYRIDRQVGDVIAVLDALSVDRAAFWGASMGGIIGMHLLARHPERLTGLVAGGAHAERVKVQPAEVEREAEVFRSQGVEPFIAAMEGRGRLPAWMRSTMLAADAHALAALATALADRDGVLDVLARVPVPLLLLAGDHDPQRAAIQRTAAQIPSATLVELPDCGHLDAFLRTDLTLPVVRPFLDRCHTKA